MVGFRFCAIAAAFALWAVMPAQAQESEGMLSRYRPPPKGTSDTYVVTLSGNGVLLPSFPGSDRATAAFYPSLTYRRSDEPERFAAPDDGISISVFDDPSFRFGPVARFQSGRYLADDRQLYGLRKLNFDFEPGLFLEYWPLTFIRARVEVRHGLRDDAGFVGDVGVDYVQPVGPLVFSLGPRLKLSDTEYANRYFGVSLAEAVTNGRLYPYRAHGGLNSVGLLGAVTYRWNETWATTGYVGYDRLVNEIADSPIVTRIGSRDQLTLGAKLSYSFNFTPSRGLLGGFD